MTSPYVVIFSLSLQLKFILFIIIKKLKCKNYTAYGVTEKITSHFDQKWGIVPIQIIES